MYGQRFCFFAAATLMFFVALARGEDQEESQVAGNPNPKIEVMAGVALGYPFRYEDQGFGKGVNLGAGVEVPVWRGLHIGAEMNHTLGLSPSLAACGGISNGPGEPPLPCVGTAHEGVDAVTAASFTASYFFGRGRIRPYLVGGLGMLWTKQTSASFMVESDHVDLQEFTFSDTGFGLACGFGLRAALTRRLSLRPELRFIDGTAMSRANLSLARLSIGIGYGW